MEIIRLWIFQEVLITLTPNSPKIYQVSLIIQDDNGCSDTTFKQVRITDDYWMYIPSSFTPDLDGINDKFCIAYHGIREATFTFNVYTRYSELVYSTNNINELNCENWVGWKTSSIRERTSIRVLYLRNILSRF